MDELLEQWRDPVFRDPHGTVPPVLATRLTDMADEITASENIGKAITNAMIPDAADDLPVRRFDTPRCREAFASSTPRSRTTHC